MYSHKICGIFTASKFTSCYYLKKFCWGVVLAVRVDVIFYFRDAKWLVVFAKENIWRSLIRKDCDTVYHNSSYSQAIRGISKELHDSEQIARFSHPTSRTNKRKLTRTPSLGGTHSARHAVPRETRLERRDRRGAGGGRPELGGIENLLDDVAEGL